MEYAESPVKLSVCVLGSFTLTFSEFCLKPPVLCALQFTSMTVLLSFLNWRGIRECVPYLRCGFLGLLARWDIPLSIFFLFFSCGSTEADTVNGRHSQEGPDHLEGLRGGIFSFLLLLIEYNFSPLCLPCCYKSVKRLKSSMNLFFIKIHKGAYLSA